MVRAYCSKVDVSDHGRVISVLKVLQRGLFIICLPIAILVLVSPIIPIVEAIGWAAPGHEFLPTTRAAQPDQG